MPNFYALLREILPPAPLLVGTVTATQTSQCVVEMHGGGIVFARGQATLGSRVFVRDGAIEGTAPALTVEVIDV